MSSDTTFITSATAVLAAIGTAIDAAVDRSDADVDWSLNDGILEIDCGANGKLIVNRHVPNREIWVAAKSGGFHFRADHGCWRDTRSTDELPAKLERLLHEQAGIEVDLSDLPAPEV